MPIVVRIDVELAKRIRASFLLDIFAMTFGNPACCSRRSAPC